MRICGIRAGRWPGLGDERGIGLIELLAAMTVLMVGILAVFAMFESGIRHLSRASTVTTAGALADKELENFRAIRYASIGLPDSLVLAAATPYSSDSAIRIVRERSRV